MGWLHYLRYAGFSTIKRDFLNATVRKWKHGFNPNEAWNLYYHLAVHILPRLEHFKKVNCAFPCSMTAEEWDAELDKMIEAFKLLTNEEFGWAERKEQIRQNKIVRRGLKSFADNFESLWY